jgi:hypothetical protein
MPQGARVLYFSASPASADALQRELLRRSQPQRARAAGGSPLNPDTPLPPVSVQVSRSGEQIVAAYEALEATDVPRLQSLALWDAIAQQSGQCPSLQVQADAAEAQAPPEPVYFTQTLTRVSVEPPILQACRMRQSERAAVFEPADARAEGSRMLRELGRCLASGALANSRVRVTSFAEPNHPEAALQRHGGSRASAFGRFLASQGVDESRLELSFAPRDPSGTDEQGWAWYRRVEVGLIP